MDCSKLYWLVANAKTHVCPFPCPLAKLAKVRHKIWQKTFKIKKNAMEKK